MIGSEVIKGVYDPGHDQGAARTLTADIDYPLVLPLQVSGVPQSGDLARLAILMFTLDTALRRDVLGRRRAYSSVRCCR